MISMQNQDLVKGLYHNRRNLEARIHWVCKHHVEEVLSVRLVLVRLHKRQALRSPVRDSGECRELSDEFDGDNLPLSMVVDVQVIMEE